jgi:hypothetical protein
MISVGVVVGDEGEEGRAKGVVGVGLGNLAGDAAVSDGGGSSVPGLRVLVVDQKKVVGGHGHDDRNDDERER